MQCNDRVHKTVSSHRRPQQTKLDSKEQEDLFKYFVSYKPEACAAGQRIASSPTSSAPSSVKKLKYSVEDRGDSSNDLPPNPTPTPTPSPTPSSTSTAEEYVTSRRRKLIDECTDETKSEAELPKETKTHVRSKNKGELSVSKDSSISSCSTSSSLSRSRPVSPSGPIRSSTRLKKTRFDEESRNGSQKIVLPLEVTPRRPQVYDRAIATGQEMRCVADEDGLEHEYAIKTVTYAAMVHDDPDLPKSKRQPTIVTPRKRSCLPIVDINSSIEPLPYRSPLKRVQDLPATPRKIASLCAPSSASSRYSPRLEEASGNGGNGVALIQDEADEIVDCPIEPEEESEDTSAIEQLMKSVREEDERNALIDAEQSDEVDDKEGAIGEVHDGEAIALAQEQTDTEVVKALDVAMQDAASKDSIQFAELCDQLSQPTSSSTPTDDTKIRLEWAEEKTLTKSDAEEVDSYERPRRITKEKDSAPVKSENSNGEVSPPLTRRLRTRKSIAPVQSKPSRRGVRKNNSPTYKVVCEAPRKSLKPILRAARRKSMLARRTLNRSLQRPKKRLQWANSPVTLCVPITPRPGFIAGKVEMPTSPIKMTVRARPDLPVDPGATSDDDTVQEFMDPHDYDANYGRQRLSSDDILFAKETAAQSTDVAKRRRSSRRSKELYYRAEDSSSQSSTPTEKSESRPKRILRRLSCLPPPKRIVDYESTTESPSDSDAIDRKAAASRSTSDRLASDSSNEVSNRQNGRLEQEDGMNGDELPSEEPALDTAPVRRSTRRSSCVYARNRSADLQVTATSDQPSEREVKRPRRLSCRPDEKVAGGSAAVEPVESLTVLKSTKPITPVEPKVFSIFNSRRSQLPSSSPTQATDEIDEADAAVSTTSDAEEKAKEEGLSSQELSSSQPLFPLFQRGRRSQILPAPEPEPPKKRGARKNTAVLNSDKNNASATSSPQPSLSLRRTRSQSKKLGADAPTKDSNGTTESAKKTQVRKKSSTTAKPQVIEEVDLTINSPPLSARSFVPTKPPPSPVVERVHSRWLGECDCAPFVELIHLADSCDLRGAATTGGSGASLKMRPKMSEEIVIPAWSSMGLVKITKTRVMNGCDESPLLSKSLVHKVVESSFTADQKAVFSRLRSVEGDPSALVWTEASRPRHASHMLGDAMAVARVENWLKTWKQRLSSGAKKTNGSAVDRMKKRGRKRRKSSDDESDYDDEDVMANPFVLAGATGVGKTALVYALAEAMGMRVIEMSSNARRATAQLRQTLTGATHTHRVSCSSVSDSPLSAFLSPSAAKKPKLTEAPPKTIGQFSIILIDDADILLPDDDGFWTTLKLFAAESRVPIVLTCAGDVADELRCVTELRRDNPDAAFDSVCLSPPTVHQLSAYLQAVALSLSSVAVSMDSLDRLCREYNCDVRRCLLAVQALVAARGGVRNGDNDDDVDGEHLPKPIDVVPLRQSGGESSLTWLQRCRLNSDAAALESTERLGRFGVQLLDGLTDAGDSLPSPYDLPSHYAEFVLSEDVDRKSAVERISHSENAVLAVRESLHKSQLCSGLNCTSVDYCSFLAQMAKTSEAQQRGSRRHQHYFDKTTTDGLIIDPHDRLKTAFARAFNSLL